MGSHTLLLGIWMVFFFEWESETFELKCEPIVNQLTFCSFIILERKWVSWTWGGVVVKKKWKESYWRESIIFKDKYTLVWSFLVCTYGFGLYEKSGQKSRFSCDYYNKKFLGVGSWIGSMEKFFPTNVCTTRAIIFLDSHFCIFYFSSATQNM